HRLRGRDARLRCRLPGHRHALDAQSRDGGGLMSSPVLLFLGLGCLSFGVAIPVVLWRAPGGTTGVARSLAALQRTTILRPRNSAGADDEGGTASVLARLGDLSRLAPAGYRASIQLLLDKAGNPRDWSLQRLFAVKLLGSSGLALLGALVGAHSPAKLFSFFVLGALAG